MRRRTKAVAIVSIVMIVLMASFVIWAETPPAPMSEALDALLSDSQVAVSTGTWLVFQPVSSNKSTGFIIYPGGRVDYRSYAPAAHAIAEEGYLVVIVPMPLNLAVFGVNIAKDVIDSFPNISSWAIGGHSLGGSMAAQFAYESPIEMKGLVLWAAYPASGTDLSKLSIRVVTIHGTNDGLVKMSDIDSSLKVLPADTVRVEIFGGNHAQFGWYGAKPGDNDLTISRELQQRQIVNATVLLLEKL